MMEIEDNLESLEDLNEEVIPIPPQIKKQPLTVKKQNHNAADVPFNQQDTLTYFTKATHFEDQMQKIKDS